MYLLCKQNQATNESQDNRPERIFLGSHYQALRLSISLVHLKNKDFYSLCKLPGALEGNHPGGNMHSPCQLLVPNERRISIPFQANTLIYYNRLETDARGQPKQ